MYNVVHCILSLNKISLQIKGFGVLLNSYLFLKSENKTIRLLLTKFISKLEHQARS